MGKMIKTGDRFTHMDLTQSINELCGGGMQKYIEKSAYGIAVGSTLIIPTEWWGGGYFCFCMALCVMFIAAEVLVLKISTPFT